MNSSDRMNAIQKNLSSFQSTVSEKYLQKRKGKKKRKKCIFLKVFLGLFRGKLLKNSLIICLYEVLLLRNKKKKTKKGSLHILKICFICRLNSGISLISKVNIPLKYWKKSITLYCNATKRLQWDHFASSPDPSLPSAGLSLTAGWGQAQLHTGP